MAGTLSERCSEALLGSRTEMDDSSALPDAWASRTTHPFWSSTVRCPNVAARTVCVTNTTVSHRRVQARDKSVIDVAGGDDRR